MEPIEVSAKTMDEAITKACIELGAASGDIEYEVLETGSAGLLGMIGVRPYVIKAWLKKAEKPAETSELSEERKPAASKPSEASEVSEVSEVSEASEPSKPAEAAAPAGSLGSLTESRAMEFLSSVFEGMGMDVSIDASYKEEERELSVNLIGDDMGVLIGKRGQTLDALQYLTSQVVNKNLDTYVRIKLDTENYRERRMETLESLARNIAYKVRRSHRSIALEPMNPYERRIIHSALQNERDVTTRSEGEEPYRHVVISYKRRGRSYQRDEEE